MSDRGAAVFPGWVFLVSVYILVAHLAGGRPVESDGARAPLEDVGV
jgi:hypothetical protein